MRNIAKNRSCGCTLDNILTLYKIFALAWCGVLIMIGSATLSFSFQPIAISHRMANSWLHEKRTPPTEVTSLFDDFAASFEKKLLTELKYVAPFEIAKAIAKRRNETVAENGGPKQYHSALDAGCGTGLMGVGLRSLVEGPLVGADLSRKMLKEAAELVLDTEGTCKNGIRRCTKEAKEALPNMHSIYDGLFVADLLDLDGTAEFLDSGFNLPTKHIPDRVDLIASADVLCYFGDLSGILEAFAKRLASGGELVFSTETMKDGDYNWVMLESERYAHNPPYVAKMAAEAGLSLVSQTEFTPRYESGEKVLGTMHFFQKCTES